MDGYLNELSAWHIWMIVGILLFIIEIFTPAFLAGTAGLGCFAAALIAFIGLGIEWQIVAFTLTVILVYITIRPLVRKYLSSKTPELRTNVDKLIGNTAKVVERIDPAGDAGRVMIFGDNWRAETISASPLEVGTRVEVLEVQGTTLIVKAITI